MSLEAFFRLQDLHWIIEENWNALGCSEFHHAVWQNLRLSICCSLGLICVKIQLWLFMKKTTVREGCQVSLKGIYTCAFPV